MVIKIILFDWVGTLYNKEIGALFNYSEEVVASLAKKYRILVLTTCKDADRRQKEIEDSTIFKYLESLYIVQEKTKTVLLKLISELGVVPQEIAVVGDRINKEILIGNKLGCITFWINSSHWSFEMPNEKSGEPSFIITTIKELNKHL